MANKPKKIERSWVKEAKPFERNNSNAAFYNSRTWRKFRKSFLDKNPLCVECMKDDLVVKATVADHIVRIEAGGDMLNEANLQALCSHHHNKKSGKESHGGYGVKSQK